MLIKICPLHTLQDQRPVPLIMVYPHFFCPYCEVACFSYCCFSDTVVGINVWFLQGTLCWAGSCSTLAFVRLLCYTCCMTVNCTNLCFSPDVASNNGNRRKRKLFWSLLFWCSSQQTFQRSCNIDMMLQHRTTSNQLWSNVLYVKVEVLNIGQRQIMVVYFSSDINNVRQRWGNVVIFNLEFYNVDQSQNNVVVIVQRIKVSIAIFTGLNFLPYQTFIM